MDISGVKIIIKKTRIKPIIIFIFFFYQATEMLIYTNAEIFILNALK